MRNDRFFRKSDTRASWIAPGVVVGCIGEGFDLFVIKTVSDGSVFLNKLNYKGESSHGWEGFEKLISPVEVVKQKLVYYELI
jgi:hypothetical protein